MIALIFCNEHTRSFAGHGKPISGARGIRTSLDSALRQVVECAMYRLRTWLPVVALIVYLVLLGHLRELRKAEPPQLWQELPGGAPSVLYLPGDGPRWPLPPPSPAEDRPAAVVLVHGYSGDQVGTGALARNLARAGYAAMNFELRGHGQNRNSFQEGAGLPSQFDAEIDAAVAFLRESPYADASRLVVMGHSMGAGAVLSWAERNWDESATVLLAGGWELLGPERPANALFLVTERELPGISESTRGLAARLSSLSAVTPGTSYGRIEDGSAVRWSVVTARTMPINL
jgi:pimeloyl-ACP methyl ester carboxylesterase